MMVLLCCLAPVVRAAEKQTAEYSVIGLFSPDREQDFRDVAANINEIELVHLDYEHALATFRYDPRTLFPDRNPKKTPAPDEVRQRLNNLLSAESNYTFSLKQTPTPPREKLTKIEIKVGILDCKGCRYAAYLVATHVDGVEQATVRPDGLVTAWIDAQKTDRAAIEAAFKKARIECLTKP